MKSAAFIVPDLEPGDILEVRWQIVSDNQLAPTFFCQDRLPIRQFSFRLISDQITCSLVWQRIPNAKLVRGAKSVGIDAHDIPAFEEEPEMPPQIEHRGVILIRFAWRERKDEEVWTELSKDLAQDFKDYCKAGSEVRAQADQLTKSLSTPEEKVRAIYQFCQSSIINTGHDNSPASVKHRAAQRVNKSPAITLKDGRGNDEEINYLFAALCSATGLNVRLGICAARTKVSTINVPNGWVFLNHPLVVVNYDNANHYFAPYRHFQPFGLLPWEDEGVQVLLANSKKPELGLTSYSAPSITQIRRQAHLRLDEDGTLEGDVSEVRTGFAAITWRNLVWEKTDEDRDNEFKGPILKRLPAAEVTALEFLNSTDAEKPLETHYHIKIPGYGASAGDSMVLAPNVFCANESPSFTAETRKYPIAFDYPEEVREDVTIALPEGYELKSGDSPPPINVADGAIVQTVDLLYSKKRRFLEVQRYFQIGANGALAFSQQTYPAFRETFRRIHEGNTHAVIFQKNQTQTSTTSASKN